ncbi:MAG: ABC transporter substrate-binding protein, partial [Actinobacteria bacterium]|nr:ABC transporter substrate-binding protein [Actinomycetota bacterium]
MKRVRERSVRTGVAIAILASLAATGCGSALSDQQMLRANSEAFRIDSASSKSPEATPGDAAPVTADTAGADTAAPSATESASAGGQATGTVAPAGPAAKATTGGARSAGSAVAAGGAGPATPAAATAASKQPSRAQSSPGGPAAAPVPGNPATPGVGGAKSEIRLGSIGQQSGVIGTALLPIVHGAKAWAADVDARGGLAGHPVRVIFGDDGGDPSRALALAKRMVEQDKVLALYGGQMAL